MWSSVVHAVHACHAQACCIRLDGGRTLISFMTSCWSSGLVSSIKMRLMTYFCPSLRRRTKITLP
jgi:hypothetical protein